MKLYLNKLFIPELEILRAFKEYLKSIDIRGLYRRVTVNASNDHPFAQIAGGASISGKINTAGLFPAIVITTAGDEKSGRLADLGYMQDADLVQLDSMEGLDDYLVTEKVKELIQAHLAERPVLYGGRYLFRRKDDISIEIWAENIDMKNQLYDIAKFFVLSWKDTGLAGFIERNALAIFDGTVRGDRSNNYNFDFGISLAGANIQFEAEYLAECIVLDTDIRDRDIAFKRINHVYGDKDGRGTGLPPDILGGGAGG
jgi:hypothetical protein